MDAVIGIAGVIGLLMAAGSIVGALQPRLFAPQ